MKMHILIISVTLFLYLFPFVIILLQWVDFSLKQPKQWLLSSIQYIQQQGDQVMHKLVAELKKENYLVRKVIVY